MEFKPKEKNEKNITVTVLILVLSLTLAACGNSNKTTLNVTATDTGYDSKTYTVPAGAHVTVNMTNTGAVEHEFAVLKKDQHVTPPFGEKDEDNIYWELDGVQPGQSKSDTFTAPTTPGQYDIICGPLAKPRVGAIHVGHDDGGVLEPTVVAARVGRHGPAPWCKVFGELEQLVAEAQACDPHAQPEDPG